MTDTSRFRHAFKEFYALPYPGRPQAMDFREWSIRLATLDSHIPGYLLRVNDGSMQAREIPDLADITREVESLGNSLDLISVTTGRDTQLKEEYRVYLVVMGRMLQELVDLANE
ncbi:hypothetical protein ACFXPZ_01535 [Streptomyces sp. NPDC059101]|uniref:hypothetical protein n=1 Tax=Streptomyces sp. NPDC059101 TaxID=3346728 RepID=UPI0036B327BD